LVPFVVIGVILAGGYFYFRKQNNTRRPKRKTKNKGLIDMGWMDLGKREKSTASFIRKAVVAERAERKIEKNRDIHDAALILSDRVHLHSL